MPTLRPVAEWLRLLEDETGPLVARLRQAHGNAPHRSEVVATYRDVLARFAAVHGAQRPVFLARAPARVNLLGMHIDHRGGAINPIAVRAMVMAVAPRDDDRVEAVNVNQEAFPDAGFSIAEELPAGPVADWEAWTREALRARAGDDPGRTWLNYLRAAVLYLENRRRVDPSASALKGMDVCVGSDIPIAAGLSSSSALVVCSMLTAMAVNRLEIDRGDLVDMCGEAEWYVGTRGGKGDHAAILFGRPGAILHIGFWPLRVESALLPAGHAIVLANSLKEANKQAGARDAFNQRVTGYVIGRLLLRRRFPEHAHRLERLRDVNPATLGVDEAAIYRMLLALPVRVARDRLKHLLPDADEQAELEAMYETHRDPPAGYAVRQVTLYAIAECLRSEMALGRLGAGDVAGFGELMNLSHEGDRVTTDVKGGREPVDHGLDDAAVERLAEAAATGGERGEAAALWRQPGGYDASCPELDELVDIARAQPGVLGAGLVGAGLGGAIAVLCREEAIGGLEAALIERYYAPRGLDPAVETCVPVEGAGVLDV